LKSFPYLIEQDDAASRVFGRHGRKPSRDVIDLAMGSLRGVPALKRLWDEVGEGADALVQQLDAYPGTQGPYPFLVALADLWERERDTIAEPEEFVATHGALDAIGHALTTIPAGSRVLFTVPGFDYRLAIARAGCRPVPVHWPIGSDLSAFIDAVDIELVDAPRGGAAIIMCLPSNPGGDLPGDVEWNRLRLLARRHGALLIVDDIYRFTGPCIGDNLGPDVVVVDSLSKRLGAPGLRLGYAKASGPRLAQLRASMGRTSVGVSSVVATLGERALTRYLDDPSIAAEIQIELAARRAYARTALPHEWAHHLHLTDIGFYGCLRTPGVDIERLVGRLAERGVLITPGSGLFGGLPSEVDRGLPFIRFCVGSDPRIEEAFGLLVEELRALDFTSARAGRSDRGLLHRPTRSALPGVAVGELQMEMR